MAKGEGKRLAIRLVIAKFEATPVALELAKDSLSLTLLGGGGASGFVGGGSIA